MPQIGDRYRMRCHRARLAQLHAGLKSHESCRAAPDGDTPPVAKRFEERWLETLAETFEFEGQLVHQLYRRPIEPGTLIDVEFLGARAKPVQGLQIKTKGARLAWDEHGLEGQSVRLWADKQDRATIRYVNPRKTADVAIWNIWLDKHRGSHSYEPDHYETVQAWWAWSGMLIEETANAVMLRCSGSYDGPDFTDLSARITFRRD